MNLEDIKKFMKDLGYGILATSDGSIAGARPMSGWAWKDSQLWCATGEPFLIRPPALSKRSLPASQFGGRRSPHAFGGEPYFFGLLPGSQCIRSAEANDLSYTQIEIK